MRSIFVRRFSKTLTCLVWCSVEDAASEVERKAMTVDGGGRATERLQRSIDELRRVRSCVLDKRDSALISRPRRTT